MYVVLCMCFICHVFGNKYKQTNKHWVVHKLIGVLLVLPQQVHSSSHTSWLSSSLASPCSSSRHPWASSSVSEAWASGKYAPYSKVSPVTQERRNVFSWGGGGGGGGGETKKHYNSKRAHTGHMQILSAMRQCIIIVDTHVSFYMI